MKCLPFFKKNNKYTQTTAKIYIKRKTDETNLLAIHFTKNNFIGIYYDKYAIYFASSTPIDIMFNYVKQIISNMFDSKLTETLLDTSFGIPAIYNWSPDDLNTVIKYLVNIRGLYEYET